MNKNIYLKPKLLDPKIEKKILQILTPPKHDYWGPAKNNLLWLYNNYIKNNFWMILLIILCVIFLLYRYIVIRNRREKNNKNNLNSL